MQHNAGAFYNKRTVLNLQDLSGSRQGGLLCTANNSLQVKLMKFREKGQH